MELQKQHLKERVIGDSAKSVKRVQKQQERKREWQKQEFTRIYNKLKIYKFPPTKKINMEKHFYFPKIVGYFQNMSKAAMAVYPVICARANFDKNTWIQLSQKHIAQMAGVSINTATKGILDLMKDNYTLDDRNTHIPLLQRQKSIKGKRHFYIYQIGFIRKDMIRRWKGKDKFFIFHTCIIDSGVWATLKPRAKLLYLAMRTRASFNADLYSAIEDIDLEDTGASNFYNTAEYRNRRWDVCETSLAELCRMVNIDNSDILKAVQQLEHYRLVERIKPVFKVYLKPKIKGLPKNQKPSKTG